MNIITEHGYHTIDELQIAILPRTNKYVGINVSSPFCVLFFDATRPFIPSVRKGVAKIHLN